MKYVINWYGEKTGGPHLCVCTPTDDINRAYYALMKRWMSFTSETHGKVEYRVEEVK